jgi:hypothetical protein
VLSAWGWPFLQPASAAGALTDLSAPERPVRPARVCATESPTGVVWAARRTFQNQRCRMRGIDILILWRFGYCEQ